MKKLFTVIAFIAPLLSFAQVEKGMFLVSGNLSYRKNLLSDIPSPISASTKQVEFTHYLGYMVSSKVAVGLIGDYLKTEYSYDPQNVFSPTDNTQKYYNTGVFVRYYQPITEKFFFFAQGDVMYGKGTSASFNQQLGITQKVELTGTLVSVRPGISYFVSKRWAIELILGSIQYAKRDQKTGTDTINRDGFAFNFLTRGLSPGVVFTF